MPKKKKKKSLGLKRLSTDFDKSVEGTQCDSMYDPFWLLDTYKLNPKNAKKHSTAQKQTLYEMIDRHGWLVPCLVNLKTGYFVDGHGRIVMCTEYGIPARCAFGWWDDSQEEEIIALFDSVSLMSEQDAEAHTSLLRNIDKRGGLLSGMKSLVVSLNERAESIKAGREKRIALLASKRKELKKRDTSLDSEEIQKAVDEDYTEDVISSALTLNTNVKFEGDENYEIPLLLPEMCYGYYEDEFESPPEKAWIPAEGEIEENDICCWTIRSSLEYEENEDDPLGFLCFFTDDKRFETIYDKVDDIGLGIMRQNFKAMFEVDYSIYWDWQFPRNLWSIYRRRYVSRYMQGLGVKIIPTIVRSIDPERDAAWLYETLPYGLTTVAMQARMVSQNAGHQQELTNSFIQSLRVAHERLEFQKVIVYGGLDFEKYLYDEVPQGVEAIFIDSYINRRRKYLADQKKKRKAGVAKR